MSYIVVAGASGGWVWCDVSEAPIHVTQWFKGNSPRGRLAHGKREVGRWVSAGRGRGRANGGQSQFESGGGQLSIVVDISTV